MREAMTICFVRFAHNMLPALECVLSWIICHVTRRLHASNSMATAAPPIEVSFGRELWSFPPAKNAGVGGW